MKVLIKDDSEKREYVSNVVVVTTPEFEKGTDFDLSKPPDSALFQFLRHSADEQNNAFTAGVVAAEKSKVRPGTNFVYRLERIEDEAAFNLKFTWWV